MTEEEKQDKASEQFNNRLGGFILIGLLFFDIVIEAVIVKWYYYGFVGVLMKLPAKDKDRITSIVLAIIGKK